MISADLEVKCKGQPGHGSQFIKDTAAEKVRKVINTFLTFRDEEEARLTSDPTLALGDVTTVNMTIMKVIGSGGRGEGGVN